MKNRTRRLVSVLIVLLVFGLIYSPFAVHAASGNLTIRYLDVDTEDIYEEYSGDVILITTPEGQNLLIDSLVPVLGDALVHKLNELGVERLDYAFATHPHIDHIGGYPTVLENIEVGKFYQINVPYNTSSYYRRLQQTLVDQDIETAFLEQGDILHIGEDITFKVFNPPQGTGPETIPSQESLTAPRVMNDLSLVMRLDYKDFSMLFTGDIYVAREMELVVEYEEQLLVDILDAPHHGSTTSSSSMLVSTAEPKYAMISNDSVFPAATYEKYSLFDIDVFATASHGDIMIVTDGDSITVTSERELSDYLQQLRSTVM